MNWRDFQALQQVTELDDRFISYVEQGDEQHDDGPLILLHGIPTWGYLWQDVLPALSRCVRVLVPDLLGFGFSDRRDCFDRSIARQAEMVNQWMDTLQIKRATFAAHDIGGGVALRMATLFPDRVSRLCLLNTVCYDSWPIEMMLQFGHPGAKRKLSASTAMTMLRMALKRGFTSSPASDFLDGLLAPYRTEVGKLSLVRNAASLNTNHTTEITHLLPRIKVPTLILWGEDDKFQAVKFAERLARDIPAARLIRIADARHFVMVDQAEQVTDHIKAFLADNPQKVPQAVAS